MYLQPLCSLHLLNIKLPGVMVPERKTTHNMFYTDENKGITLSIMYAI